MNKITYFVYNFLRKFIQYQIDTMNYIMKFSTVRKLEKTNLNDNHQSCRDGNYDKPISCCLCGKRFKHKEPGDNWLNGYKEKIYGRYVYYCFLCGHSILYPIHVSFYLRLPLSFPYAKIK